jgi:hypothetical protein
MLLFSTAQFYRDLLGLKRGAKSQALNGSLHLPLGVGNQRACISFLNSEDGMTPIQCLGVAMDLQLEIRDTGTEGVCLRAKRGSNS